MTVTIIADCAFLGNGSLTFKYASGYDAALIGTLKSLVPPPARTYDPATHVWTFAEHYADAALRCVQRRTGVQVRLSGERQRRGFRVITGGAGDPDLKTLYVRDDAPWEVVEAAYRALSKLHHPDRGGDTAAMQQINGAFERLQTRQRNQGVA